MHLLVQSAVSRRFIPLSGGRRSTCFMGHGHKRSLRSCAGRVILRVRNQTLVAQPAHTYLHNAAGQRVFKSDPKTEATAQINATLGNSYLYADG